MINESTIAKTNGHDLSRRYSTTFPAVFFCVSCCAAQVDERGHLCKPCIVKEAERFRYDAWYIERRNRVVLWAAILTIGAIVVAVNWWLVVSK